MLRVALPLVALSALAGCARPRVVHHRPTWSLAVTPVLGLGPALVTARVFSAAGATCGAEITLEWPDGSSSGHQSDCAPGEAAERVVSSQHWLLSGEHEIVARVRTAESEHVLRQRIELR